jgi:flagellum-specific ATP synthase
MNFNVNFDKYERSIRDALLTRDIGKVTGVTGLVIRGFVPGCSLGSICVVFSLNRSRSFLAEVVGFRGQDVLMMPLGQIFGVGLGSRIELLKSRATVVVGDEMLGRVIDGQGEPIDSAGKLNLTEEVLLYAEVGSPMKRQLITKPLSVGVRAIDGMLTLGAGQRIAIMAGSGVGKSMLLGQIARDSSSDINVIALIGERGREVKEFVENSLGKEGLKRSVVVAVTSDQSPLVRMRGAYLATAISEYFANKGKNVLLMMDSVTRFAMAQREVGLSAGEPPTSKGYTPSVFSHLPKLLERAGYFESNGSITGIYSVLVEGDDMDEPIADAVRSIVDGHIVLDRRIAQKAHFPAIDILQSTSRVMRSVVSKEHFAAAMALRESMATYKEAEDLINIGAYKQGTNPNIDSAMSMHDQINRFLKQDVSEKMPYPETLKQMAQVFKRGGR